jgi:hypothetical protein
VGVVVGGTSLKKRRSAAGAAPIFLDERESVGLLEELSAVGAEPLGGSAGLDKVRGPGQGLPSSLAGGSGPRTDADLTQRTREISPCLNRRGRTGPSTIVVLDPVKALCDDDGSRASGTGAWPTR